MQPGNRRFMKMVLAGTKDEWNCPGDDRNCGCKVAATRYRVPDVTVLDRSRPIEQIITHPPLAVFDVSCLPKTGCSVSNSSWKTTGRWVYRKSGSLIPRTAPFIAMKNLQLQPHRPPSRTPKKAFDFDMNQLKNLLD